MKRWLGRFSLAVVVAILAVAAFLAFSGYDIPPPDVPNLILTRSELPVTENAYTYFAAAANARYWPWDDETFRSAYLRREPIEAERFREIVARNEDAVDLIRQGLACGVCQSPSCAAPDDMWAPTAIHDWFDMARMLSLLSRENQRAGRIPEAVDACGMLVGIGAMLQRNAELFIVHVAGMGVLSMGIARAREIASDEGASSEGLERLAMALAAVGPLEHGLTRMIKGEFMYHCRMVDQRRTADFSGVGIAWSKAGVRAYGRELLQRSRYSLAPGATKRMLGDLARSMIANLPRCYAEIERVDEDAFFGLKGRSAPRIWTPNALGNETGLDFLVYEVVFEMKCRDESDLAAARLIVALNRYRKDRDGFPENLQALVPDYLAAVPRDPYDGRLFRYARDKGVVYAVGVNLADDGGDAEEGSKRRFHQRRDLVYRITGSETPVLEQRK